MHAGGGDHLRALASASILTRKTFALGSKSLRPRTLVTAEGAKKTAGS
jgi:hypothetical protein